MKTKYYKYPRTPHANYSKPNPHGNDVVCEDQNHFTGKEIIATVKLDGEGTSLYRDKCHARSIDSSYHPSRTWLRGLHASICNKIKDGWRICGENLQAKHAIYYTNLPTYFFVFGVYNEQNICINWKDTVEVCKELGLSTVPVLYSGVWNEDRIKKCYSGRSIVNGIDVGEQEGYVVRVSGDFDYNDFDKNVYKYVRPGHVAGDTEHWSKTGYKPNKLIVK